MTWCLWREKEKLMKYLNLIGLMDSQDHHDWTYRAEGNCSLVVCNKKKGRALRILKVQKDSCERPDTDEAVKTMYFTLVQFAACVAERLFGEYIDVPAMKALPVDFLKSLSTMVKMERPDKRQEKTIALCPYVLDLPDYAYLPSVATQCKNKMPPSFMFELKPGSVSRRYGKGTCLSAASCYYCLNKTQESMNCGGKKVSRYCPQELFSGNSKRMKRCIKVLLEDINMSRNKLRLFKDGVNHTGYLNNVQDLLSMLHPYCSGSDQYTGTAVLADLLYKCLTHKQSACRRRTVCPDAMSPYTSRRRHHSAISGSESLSMPADCVLSVFASAQSHGAMSLSELTWAYERLSHSLEGKPGLAEKLCLNGPYDTGMWRLTSQPQTPPGVDEQDMAAFIIVRNYLIYRTAKDSSVLITIQPIDLANRMNGTGGGSGSIPAQDKMFKVVDVVGNTYLCCVAIIDLDPKPFSKMKQYIQSEMDLHQLYQRRHRAGCNS